MSAFVPATTIAEVIDRLNAIIQKAIEDQSAVGMFTALYVVVTEKIKEGIEKGNVFQKNDRMERLDVIFANRYLEAYHAHLHGGPMTETWKLGFQVAEQFPSHIILQELLASMNAHINLDLGIASAEVAPGEELADLHKDFLAVNQILGDLTGKVRRSINHLSPRIAMVDSWFGKADDVILNFSLRKARDAAWEFAQELAPLPRDEWEPLIHQHDLKMLKFGKGVASPGFLAWLVVWWVKRKESKDVPLILNDLRNTANKVATDMVMPSAEDA